MSYVFLLTFWISRKQDKVVVKMLLLKKEDKKMLKNT